MVTNPMIIEGCWNVGKTTLAELMCQTYGYELIREPNHMVAGIHEPNVADWYIAQHAAREQALFTAAERSQAVVIERSTISVAAFDYAAREHDPQVAQAMEKFAQRYRAARPLVVFLYQDAGYLSTRGYQIHDANVLNRLKSEEFDRRYEEFYRQILPLQYDIVPLFLRQPDDYSAENSQQSLRTIETALQKCRLAQINVVPFRTTSIGVAVTVLKRTAERGGFWQTVTGGVKPWHGIRQTVEKELTEELSIQFDQQRVRPTDYVFSYTGAEDYELNEYVVGYELDESDAITLSDEHSEYQELPMSEAKSKVKYETNAAAIERVTESQRLMSLD